MKLTEQQLAQMFQQSKNVDSDAMVDDLYNSTDASDRRLADVEKIANNSTLSASYLVMNQLNDWSQAVGNEIQLSLKPRFVTSVFSWFKPAVATAAFVTAVYFVTPQIENQTHHQMSAQQPDQIMFHASFENNGDAIKTMSFDNNKTKSDIIAKSTFG